MAVELRDYQIEAIKKMNTGSILSGGVGSGKSRTALGYFLFIECNGCIKVNGKGKYRPMKYPKDLYIITTAKKRDSLDWEKECGKFGIFKEREHSICHVGLFVDSWNNIQKYKNVQNAFFIFDEQRVVGKGPWVKTFIYISKHNHWILLSATPGDKWEDYIPVFIANGFYRNRTEFLNEHCIFARATTYPIITGYMQERKLRKLRDSILVPMDDQRHTVRHPINVIVDYDKEKYRTVFRDRWNPYEEEPIQETGKLFYLMRQVVNSDPSRIAKTREIVEQRKRCVIFYNYNYELDLLRDMCKEMGLTYAEWNGQKHEDLPTGERWVYLVQYAAGCEGWNCITADTIIFYSQNYSYRMTEQAAGRIDRMNTPFTDLYFYYLRSNSPIDLAIKRALNQKRNFNERSFKL